jgi:hypothetical protein
MRVHRLFTASAVLLVLGLASLWSKWNGNAGINAGTSLDSWAVSFNGSVHGLPALIGVILILAAIIVFLVALIKTALGPSRA